MLILCTCVTLTSGIVTQGIPGEEGDKGQPGPDGNIGLKGKMVGTVYTNLIVGVHQCFLCGAGCERRHW